VTSEWVRVRWTAGAWCWTGRGVGRGVGLDGAWALTARRHRAWVTACAARAVPIEPAAGARSRCAGPRTTRRARGAARGGGARKGKHARAGGGAPTAAPIGAAAYASHARTGPAPARERRVGVRVRVRVRVGVRVRVRVRVRARVRVRVRVGVRVGVRVRVRVRVRVGVRVCSGPSTSSNASLEMCRHLSLPTAMTLAARGAEVSSARSPKYCPSPSCMSSISASAGCSRLVQRTRPG
jgi:hypothetical protein